NGVTGDPWTPIDRKGSKALTLGAQGFNYVLTQELLVGQSYERPIALEATRSERAGAFFLGACLVRGQGKTEGLHERIVEITPPVARLLGKPDERERIGARARQRVDQAAEVRKAVLF